MIWCFTIVINRENVYISLSVSFHLCTISVTMCSHVFFVIKIYLLYTGVCVLLCGWFYMDVFIKIIRLVMHEFSSEWDCSRGRSGMRNGKKGNQAYRFVHNNNKATCWNHQAADWASERTTPAATTFHPAGHSTDRSRSSPGPYQTGTDCPRRLWQPSRWTVLSPGSTRCCKHQMKVPPA